MQKKRKAAKDVFLEQQRNVDLDDEEFYPPEEALLGADELYEMEEIPAPAPEFTQNIATEGAVPLPQMAEPQQVLSNQEVDALLSGVSNAPVPPKSAPQMRKKMPKKNDNYIPSLDIKTSEELQLEKEAIKVRETGMLFWRRVIVPPNAFVVHTRINKADPITLGLGQSFRFNPNTDSYLVIPAAMQTIGVVANCISKEKQGINVLAYVQWQIDDFSIAYKKLDLTNTNDPLGIVNAQLREQAEAAIKDKIATMSVEEVLTDKAPVIEELTSRLRRVAEGQEGLGIKIITVQIREALVSSAALWNDLQSPYRNEQRQKARISQLEMENEINKKELETKKFKENRQAETNLEIEKTRQHKLTETTELRLQEESKRFEEEQKNIQHKQSLEEETVLKKKEQEDRLISKEREIQYKQEIEDLEHKQKKSEEEAKFLLEEEKRQASLATEKQLFAIQEEKRIQETRKEAEMQRVEAEKIVASKQAELQELQAKLEEALANLKLQAELDREKNQRKNELDILTHENEVNFRAEEFSAKAEALFQQARNEMNHNQLTSQLIERLPQIAAEMPKIKDLKVFQSDKSDPNLDALSTFIAKIMELTQSWKK